ncbi:MAG: hypothetical protein M1826_002166 [Phylliscum demangeonii]|nr:MAG: hypothetical protein M1826_002166 [Phylliscum demangeonii]
MAPPFSSRSWGTMLALILALLSLCRPSHQRVFQTVDPSGNTIYLDDARKPSLFTKDFGDCLGSSVVNVTRFDAAYYKDNMTVIFHLQGSTNVRNESLMMYIGVFAYGESRFDLTFNPCNANIDSLCPMKRGIPIRANGIIPVAPSDVSNIPGKRHLAIALTIPDFEGEAILRIFANSTQSEIGCYSAVVTNGATFSQPKAVGSVLGIFTALALIASFATAVYGDHVPTTRKHYAHSLSVLVVFSVLQHIFFTGALSMNWPSVLPAFWSNYAWAAGMIYTDSMQRSINHFLGSNLGNTSFVGAASSGAPLNGPQLLFALGSIYPKTGPGARPPALRARAPADDFTWFGQPVRPGMPLPGNFSGFAGTLGAERIPASNAFLTAFLWLLILLVCLAGAIVAFKWLLEGLRRLKLIKPDRLAYFRQRWLAFTAVALLRTWVASFFMIMLLTLFQFCYSTAAGVTAIAALVFCLSLVGTTMVAAYALYYRLRRGRFEIKEAPFPWPSSHAGKGVLSSGRGRKSASEAPRPDPDPTSFRRHIPWRAITYVDRDAGRTPVHDDEDYLVKFGWLTARFRRTRWWFFAVWIGYELIRALFYGAGVGHPVTQVFGLLAVEIIALIAIVKLRPFEGQRLNALMVYVLGFSKVATVALSAAFDARFNLPRIQTTIIGVVIIVIQGLLTIVLLIAIAVSLVSSYMSLTRTHETFKPRRWMPMRERYFRHLDRAAADRPPTPAEPPKAVEPGFNVGHVRRQPKIEDEDDEFMAEVNDPTASRLSMPPRPLPHAESSRRPSLADTSIMSTTIPFGARVHRASWSTRDFESAARHDVTRSPGRPTARTSMLRSASPATVPATVTTSAAAATATATATASHVSVSATPPPPSQRSSPLGRPPAAAADDAISPVGS